jgi:hypothetical protein
VDINKDFESLVRFVALINHAQSHGKFASSPLNIGIIVFNKATGKLI